MIRIPQVRVIDDEGNQLGIMPTPKALEMAQEKGLDLVEVAPMASPPVTRFLDFGQYKYELTKKEKEAKRRQRSVTFKEVRLSPKIGIGDFETKVHRAIEFLEDGDRIKVTVRFRGRELTHPELGRNLIAKFTDQVKDHGIAERTPVLEGKSMFITMASTHKPKGQDVPVRPGRPADGEAPEEGAPAETAPAETAPERAAPVAAAPKAAASKAAASAGAPPAGASSNGTAPKGVAPKADAPVVATPAPASPAPEPATTGE